MKNYKKLIIYFEPSPQDLPGVISITLSFSRLNEKDNTYKQKLIMQVKNSENVIEKYKIKEFHIGADKIIEKINKIDFEDKYDKVSDDENSETFLIKYGEVMIYTSNRNQISQILHLFRFNRLASIPCEHYKYIHNMYEYVDLVKILNKKRPDLSNEQDAMLNKLLNTDNPYNVFQSMGWIKKFLDDTIKR